MLLLHKIQILGKEKIDMAEAMKCDRCHKFYLLSDGVEFRPTYAGLHIFKIEALSQAYNRVTSYDLCPECATKLVEFMRGGGEE